MTVLDAVDYDLILLKEEARRFLRSRKEKHTALDFETTGLSPKSALVRLSCIMGEGMDRPVLIDHWFAGAFSELIDDYLHGPYWYVYNAKFETRWFDHFRPYEADLIDVDFMAKVKLGGHPSSLAKMVKRDQGIELNKEQQLSDWSRSELTPSQYDYAAEDAVATWKEVVYWRHEIKKAKIPEQCVYTLQDAVRPTIECEDTGIGLDVDYHIGNIFRWEAKQALCLRYLRRFTPKSVIDNLNSDSQVSKFLKSQLGDNMLAHWPKTDAKQQLKLDRASLRPIIRQSPYPFSRWLTAFMRYRYYNKYLSTYGMTLVRKQELAGVVNFRLNIAQAATKRYSSSDSNIQNIPRAKYVRKAFLPPPGFEFFCTADYSGIEIRTLARVSGDTVLEQDAIYTNMHASMAALSNGYDEDAFLERLKDGDALFKEMRTKAKAGTFRLTYGAGPGAVADSMNSTVSEAEDFIRKWAAKYPKAYGYRNTMFDYMNYTGFLPMCDGSTIYVRKPDRTLPVAANYGVQGAAALVMLAAMARCFEVRNKLTTLDRVRFVATVHDEIVLACRREEDIAVARVVLQQGMEQGWLDIFPDSDLTNLIEIGSGRTWGDCK